MRFNINQSSHGKPIQPGRVILCKARYLVDEFQVANLKIPTILKDRPIQWVLPKLPWYKINVDGAVFSSLESLGMGAVI